MDSTHSISDYYLWHDEKGNEHCRPLFNVTEWRIPGSIGNQDDDIRRSLYQCFANDPPAAPVLDFDDNAADFLEVMDEWARHYEKTTQCVTDGETIYEGHLNIKTNELTIERYPVEKRLDSWAFYEYGQTKQAEYEKTQDVNDFTVEPIQTDWAWLYSFRDSEVLNMVLRDDRISQTVTLGLKDEANHVVASVQVVINKDDNHQNKARFDVTDHSFYVDGEPCPIKANTPIFQRLQKEADLYLAQNQKTLSQNYFKEWQERFLSLPVRTFPAIFEAYEFELENGEKVTAPDINLKNSYIEPEQVIKNVLLKEILPEWSYLYQFNDNIDPFKYERLANRLGKTVVVADGSTVYAAQIDAEKLNAPGLKLDPMGWIQQAVDHPLLLGTADIKEVTKLNQLLPFDSDWAEELQNGRYLPARKGHSR